MSRRLSRAGKGARCLRFPTARRCRRGFTPLKASRRCCFSRATKHATCRTRSAKANTRGSSRLRSRKCEVRVARIKLFTVDQAERALPLVRRVVTDIVNSFHEREKRLIERQKLPLTPPLGSN